jgi:prefoldin alpha subunit
MMNSINNQIDLAPKVETYEKFINEKLKVDLEKVLEQLDSVYDEMAEYLQIKETINKINEKRDQFIKDEAKSDEDDTEPFKLKTRIDIGCNFYVNAIVEDTSKINIAIGYGFFLEMTLSEALQFIEKKLGQLNKNIDELKSKTAEIKANIKFVLEGLSEIQNLNNFKSSTTLNNK